MAGFVFAIVPYGNARIPHNTLVPRPVNISSPSQDLRLPAEVESVGVLTSNRETVEKNMQLA